MPRAYTYLYNSVWLWFIYIHCCIAHIGKYAPQSVRTVRKKSWSPATFFLKHIASPRSLYISVNQSLHRSVTMQTTKSDATQWLDGLKHHPGETEESPAAPPGVLYSGPCLQMFLQQGLLSSVVSALALLMDTALMGVRTTSLLFTFL